MAPSEIPLTAQPGIAQDVARVVGDILREARLWATIAPLGGTPRLCVEAVVAGGEALAAAHGNWQPSALSHIEGLPPFPRQPAETVTPHELVRVTCECVHETSGGMSSYYGFRGYFVSLLVSVPLRAVWDARVEPAS